MAKGAAKKPVLEDLFLREKPAKIIIALKTAKSNVYATILSKEADCTYSHTIKILDVLRDMGLVEFEKKGRIKTVKLTSDGLVVANNLDDMRNKLIEVEDKKKKQSKKGDKK